MKNKRMLAMFLAVVMLLSALASCATGDLQGEVGSDPSQTSTAENTEAEETVLTDDLPNDLDFNGDKIVFISCDEMVYDDLTGDLVEDSVYERNKIVEGRLGVTISCILESNAIDKVSLAVNGGSKDYDIMLDNCWETAPKIVNNFFYDLRKTTYLDFDKIYWNQSFNEVMSYNGEQYAVTGAMTLSLYRNTFVTVFNKDLFTSANQPFLYEYVENGTWTLDKQASLIPLFHQDNGNGKQDESGDIYGFITNDFVYVDPYWASCEIKILNKNREGEYEWAFDVNKLHDMADKVLNLFYSTDGAAYIVTEDATCEVPVIEMFAAGSGAMATLLVNHLENGAVRGMTQEYGVVPIPRYSETQDRYYSQMLDHFGLICMLTTVGEDRADMLSAVLEAMCSSSYKIIRPAYYETTLRTKLAKDPQSAAMMDMIMNNIVIDPGFVYSHSMGSFHQGFQQLMASKQNDAVSRYKRMTTAAQRGLGSLLRQLDRMAQK